MGAHCFEVVTKDYFQPQATFKLLVACKAVQDYGIVGGMGNDTSRKKNRLKKLKS